MVCQVLRVKKVALEAPVSAVDEVIRVLLVLQGHQVKLFQVLLASPVRWVTKDA